MSSGVRAIQVECKDGLLRYADAEGLSDPETIEAIGAPFSQGSRRALSPKLVFVSGLALAALAAAAWCLAGQSQPLGIRKSDTMSAAAAMPPPPPPAAAAAAVAAAAAQQPPAARPPAAQPPAQGQFAEQLPAAASDAAAGANAAMQQIPADAAAVQYVPDNDPAAAAAAIQAGASLIGAGECSPQGTDCRNTTCCKEPGMQCYKKDNYWAECRVECNAGPDPTDQVSPMPWACDALGERTPGTAVECAADGEDCSQVQCCKTAGARCFTKDATWASCMAECTPGPNLMSDDASPWECTPLGDVAKGAAPWVAQKCAAKGTDCRAKKCCQDSGSICYTKSKFWGECKPGCNKGEIMPSWDKTPWECGTVGSRTPASAVAGGANHGVIKPWVVSTCGKLGADCTQSQCCYAVGAQCFEKDGLAAACMIECSTAPDPVTNVSSTCKPLGPKGWGLATKGWPSLFCFSVLRVTGYEPGLMREQAKIGAGIFGCDGYNALTADGSISLGVPKGAAEEVMTIQFQGTGPIGVSQDGTAANALLFMKVWDKIIKGQRFRDYDWTVKVDPDAVLIAPRLRDHMRPHTGENVYVVNCNKVPGSPNFPMMFGALEVFSNKAMSAYAAGSGKCGKDFWPAWQQWGEDYFMTHCLDHLGVGRISDFGVLGDSTCTGANCHDSFVASFHAFKSVGAWMGCWNTATAGAPPPAP